MKKRLFGLFLCMIMIVAVFTSCNNSGNVQTEDLTVPMTVTLTMITDEETTDAGRQMVQDAINRITEKSLNTHVVLQLYTENQYYAAVEAKLKAREEDEKAGIQRISMGKADDIVLNQYGREITVYPTPYPNQIDIFLLKNGTQLIEYYQQGYLSDIGSALASDGVANLLNKYISADVLNYGKIGEIQYAVPGNSLYSGEYEYLLINKELFDKYNYDIDEVTDELSSIEDYLVDLAKYEKDVLPLYNINYLGLESATGRPSVVGTYIPEDAVLNEETMFAPSNIISIDNVRKALTTVNAFASINGDYPIFTDDVDFDKTFGAAYIKGSSATPAEYTDDYYVVDVKGPRLTTEDIYGSMFAVSSFTTDADRCMEIVNLINTDSTVRNLLQYGVENAQYTVDDDTGIVSKIANPKDDAYYSMNMYKTGNMFLLMPNDEMTERELLYSANNWALAKQTAADAFRSPNVGFALKFETVDDLEESYAQYGIMLEEDIERLELLYDELWTKMAEYDVYVDTATGVDTTFSGYLDYLSRWVSGNKYVSYANSVISKQYRDWYNLVVYPDGLEE